MRTKRLAVRRVGQELDALAAQPIVHMRVVDDLAGQEDAAIGKALARLIRVVDRAVHAVTESELAREMNGEPPLAKLKVFRFDLLDEIAVVVLIQLGRDHVFQVEALAKHERGGHGFVAVVEGRGSVAPRRSLVTEGSSLRRSRLGWS